MTVTNEAAGLIERLRLQMTAVNQQFTHILALQAWGEDDLAARITRVDNVDFPLSMRIANYLIGKRVPLALPGTRFCPGNDPASIVAAELEIERAFTRALEAAVPDDVQAAELRRQVAAPRRKYAAFLERRIAARQTAVGNAPADIESTAALVGRLLSLVEQAMLHAFMHRQRDDRDAADDAWSTSGAAMMHLTALVRGFAALRSVPGPHNGPAFEVRYDPDAALDADLELAAACADAARDAAAQCRDAGIAGICAGIATACRELADWDRISAHPAERSNPPAFQSFDATLDKFVR